MRGFSLVEILVAVAVLLVSFVSVLTAFQVATRQGRASVLEVQAAALAEEGVEAVTTIRDAGWANLSSLAVGTPYDLIFTGTQWATTLSPQTIDGSFRRSVTVGEVYRRNSDKDIVVADSPDPKAIDTGTKKITVRVAWATSTPNARERVMEAYLTNLFE